MTLNDEHLRLLEGIPNQIQEEVIKMLFGAGSGDSAGSSSTADILSALPFHVMNHDPRNPD